MSKDPAILFYTSDFLTGTMTMTDDQVGKYIRLLCLQHQKGFLTEKDMIFICSTQCDQNEIIYSKFEHNGNGYYNKRLRFEIEKRAAYSASRSSNRLKGKEKKAKNHINNICQSYDEHMENENVNENINNKEDKDNNISICPQKEILNLWAKILPDLSQPKQWDEQRQKLLASRWKEKPEHQSLEWWEKFFNFIRGRPFLMGEVDPKPGFKRFFASLPWVLKKENFWKIREGNF